MKNKRLKLMFIGITVLVLIFTAVGCASSGGTKYNDGKYDGVSNTGRGGDVNVEVNVTDGKIAGVTVTAHNETPGVGTPAIERIPVKIVETQSTEIEAITGATITSNAIIEAVNVALDEAK